MAPATQAELSITAVPVDGTDRLFDGTPIIPGIHLRWAFTPEMGFPRNGFELYRRRHSQTEFGLERQDWQRIASLDLPHLNRGDRPSSPAAIAASVSIAVERLQSYFANPRLNAYRRKTRELIELLDRLKPDDMFNSLLSKPDGTAAVGIQDILLLASLDPYAARMLGLYFIDREVAPGEPVDYYVRGDWGGSTWPLKYRPFTNRRCEPVADPPSGCWRLDDIVIESARAVEVSFVEGSTADEDFHILALRGSPGVFVRFVFPELVEEIRIDIRRTDGDAEWRAIASNYVDVIHADQVYDVEANPYTTLTGTEDRVIVRAEHGFGIKRLDLYDDSGVSNWEIRGVGYRQHTESLDDLESRVLHVNPPSVTTPFIRRDVLLERPVVMPRAQGLIANDKPLALDEDGTVPLSTTQVELSARVDDNRSNITGPLLPVRMHVRRGRHASGRGALLTDSGRSKVMLPRLVAAWKLDGSSRDSRDTIETGRYDGEQVGDRTHLFFNPLNFISGVRTERRTLELYTESTGGKVQGGFVRYRNIAELESLRRYLRLHCWVAPRPGQVFPTLIGNNYRQGFWFGLESTDSDDRFRLRFWINNRAFSSNGTIPADRNARDWSQVGVEYDGKSVRFSIDGELDVAHSASLGSVAANAERTLCLGAEYSADDASDLAGHFPYSGAMADVQIWGDYHRVPLLDLPDLVAALPLDRTLTDRLTELPLVLEPAPVSAPSEPPPSPSGFFQLLANLLRSIVNFLRRLFSLSVPDKPEREETEAEVFRMQHPFSKDKHSLELDGRSFLKLESHPLSSQSFDQITTQLWVNPAANQSRAVLIDNNSESFQLGLVAADSGYQVQTWLNGQSFLSNSTIAPDSWTNISVSYDGESVQTSIDGELDSDEPASLGPLAVNENDVLAIGADFASTLSERLTFYRGLISDIFVWSSAPDPSSPVILRDKAELPEDAAETDFISHNVPDGHYDFQVQGVDVFGRTSTWSSNRDVLAQDTVPPPTPVNIGGRFLPLSGTLVRKDGETNVTDISFPITATGRSTGSTGGTLLSGGDLVRYDAEFYRAGDTADAPPKSQVFEIAAASLESGSLGLQLHEAALPILIPGPGDRVAIEIDAIVRVRWAWTGMQRLFTPKASAFRIYVAQTPARIVDGQPVFAESLESGDWGDAYREIPIAAPESIRSRRTAPLAATRLTVGQKRDMFDDRDHPILWMPGLQGEDADDKHRVYRIEIDDIELPTGIASPDAANYVSAALVGYNHDPAVRAWRAYPIIWYESNESGGLTVYLHDEDINFVSPPQLSRVRFYPGVAYTEDIPLRDLPVFSVSGQAIPSREYHCTVTAVNTGGYESERTPAKLVAVDRRRPLPPPRPRVRLGQQDYYGKAPADVSWIPGPERVSYLLYRATDSAIFTRDLEQRRQRLGYYRFITPAEIFRDDADFSDWIATASNRFEWPELTSDWSTLLFVPKPTSIRRSGEMPSDPAERVAWTAWDRATPVWRAWADRFFPSRTNEVLIRIAQRGGNETAFGLVTERAIEATQFTDSINGRVRNRYFYRLRTQSVSGLVSSQFGQVSLPATVEYFDPPRTPEINKIEAGNRRIGIYWPLIREPNLDRYVLYRADDAAELEDLRVWNTDPDPRVVTDLSDPLLRTHRRGLRIPGSLNLSAAGDIQGVYRIDEFDFGAGDPGTQPQAINHWVTDSAYPDGISTFAAAPTEEREHSLANLRPIADGAIVVVVYRDASNSALQVLSQTHSPGFEDHDVRGLEDYFYRLVVVAKDGNRSTGSSAVRARATDTMPPEAPVWDRVQRSPLADGLDRINLSWQVTDPNSRCIVQRRSETQASWRKSSEWLETPSLVAGTDDTWVFSHQDDTASSSHGYFYRIKILSGAGNVNAEFNSVFVEPI